MKLQFRLYALIGSLSIPLLLNLLILAFLIATVIQSSSAIDLAVSKQASTLQMQIQLRDAEAALYRYQIEGDIGFANQFQLLAEDYQNEISNFRSNLRLTPQEEPLIAQLENTDEDISLLGDDLIRLRDAQSKVVTAIQSLQSELEILQVRFQAETTEYTVDLSITDMFARIREMHLASITYLIDSSIQTRLKFADAVIAFDLIYANISEPERTSYVNDIKFVFDQSEQVGLQLINNVDQLQTLFAQFAAKVFYVESHIISGQMQSMMAQNLISAQSTFTSRVTSATVLSVLVSVVAASIAIVIAIVILHQITTGIQSLMQGATRISVGDFSQQISIRSQDELGRLGRSFNLMMRELSAREDRLQLRIQELEDLRQKLAIVQEEERRLVGLDLHDGLTQILLSANMHLNVLASIAINLNETEAHELQTARNRLQEAITEARWVVSELRPIELEDFGLVDGLRQYVTKVATIEGWKFRFVTDVNKLSISRPIETAIFRITQEALSNIRKYAQPKQVHVHLFTTREGVTIKIQDWGKGFSPSSLENEVENLGLIGMQERAESIGGTLSIDSQIGFGTIIRLEVIIKDNLRKAII